MKLAVEMFPIKSYSRGLPTQAGTTPRLIEHPHVIGGNLEGPRVLGHLNCHYNVDCCYQVKSIW